MTLELIENPELLFSNNINFTELLFSGYKLYDYSFTINNDSIKSAVLQKLPKGATGRSYSNFSKEGYVTYFFSDKALDYYLQDSIISVKRNGGWLHFYNGFTFTIEDKRIVEIKISIQIVEYYKNIPESEIETLFGKADIIIQDMNNEYAECYKSEYIYKNRKMKIIFNYFEEKITDIYIGNSNY